MTNVDKVFDDHNLTIIICNVTSSINHKNKMSSTREGG